MKILNKCSLLIVTLLSLCKFNKLFYLLTTFKLIQYVNEEFIINKISDNNKPPKHINTIIQFDKIK